MAFYAPGYRPRSRLSRYSTVLRGGLLVLVFAFGFIGLSAGVELSARELDASDYLANIYYTLSLFVVGGVDLGTPKAGPGWAKALLWITYIAAPLITASAVVEAALRILNPRARRMRRLHDHVIVCGAGRLALLYIKRLREHDARVPIVVIERDPTKARLGELEVTYKAVVVVGDIASDAVLDAVAIGHARRVMLLVSDDFANLDAAARILRRMPWLRGRVIAHVADLAFMRAIPAQTIEVGFEVYNSLESAAIHLVEARLIARFEATEHCDLVVLAGFGRFGQTVLHQLQQKAHDAFGPVVLLDLEAQANALRFADSPGFGDYTRHIIQGHLHHPAVWQQVDQIIAKSEGAPVIVVGTGDEGTNLRAALDLRRRYHEAHITVRSFGRSPFAEDVATQTGLQLFELGELISSSMPPTWFELHPRAKP